MAIRKSGESCLFQLISRRGSNNFQHWTPQKMNNRVFIADIPHGNSANPTVTNFGRHFAFRNSANPTVTNFGRHFAFPHVREQYNEVHAHLLSLLQPRGKILCHHPVIGMASSSCASSVGVSIMPPSSCTSSVCVSGYEMSGDDSCSVVRVYSIGVMENQVLPLLPEWNY